MTAAWKLTVCALMLTGACVVLGNTPPGWACGITALACMVCGGANGSRAIGEKLRELREKRRRKRGWTPQDEAILRGERRLPSAPRRCGRCTLWENVPCICGDVPCPSPSCPAREVRLR